MEILIVAGVLVILVCLFFIFELVAYKRQSEFLDKEIQKVRKEVEKLEKEILEDLNK